MLHILFKPDTSANHFIKNFIYNIIKFPLYNCR